MEIPTLSAHVRKITPSRPRPTLQKQKPESDFIKTNKTLVKKLQVRNIPFKQDEIQFKFENSAEILKSRSGLVMNSKRIEEGFEMLKMHDEKLQKRILDLQNTKLKAGKPDRPGRSGRPGSYSNHANGTLANHKKTLSKGFIREKIQKKLLKTVALENEKQKLNSVGVQTIFQVKDRILEAESHSSIQEIEIKSIQEANDMKSIQEKEISYVKQIKELPSPVFQSPDLDSLSVSIQESDEEAIYIQHIKTREFKKLEISQEMLNNILQGKEDYQCHGNYLKKFGMHRGSLEKFWDFLRVISSDILDEILESQLEYLDGLFDHFVDDLIRDELS